MFVRAWPDHSEKEGDTFPECIRSLAAFCREKSPAMSLKGITAGHSFTLKCVCVCVCVLVCVCEDTVCLQQLLFYLISGWTHAAFSALDTTFFFLNLAYSVFCSQLLLLTLRLYFKPGELHIYSLRVSTTYSRRIIFIKRFFFRNCV